MSQPHHAEAQECRERMASILSPLKWHGGKRYLAKRIAALFPPHSHYVEPFAGGLSVLLAKDPEGVSEVANDLDGDLTNFWRVLQGRRDYGGYRDPFAAFVRLCEATPFSEAEYDGADEFVREWPVEGDVAAECPEGGPGLDVVRSAWAFFVQCRQSLAGRREDFAVITKRRTRRGMNADASAWLSAVSGLPEVHARLSRVAILNRPALDVIRQQDGEGTVFYLDPPYLPDTRAEPSVYRHEMTADDHQDLLFGLAGLRGKAVISGYRNSMYDALLSTWVRVDFPIANHAAGGMVKRRMVESCWCNFIPECEWGEPLTSESMEDSE